MPEKKIDIKEEKIVKPDQGRSFDRPSEASREEELKEVKKEEKKEKKPSWIKMKPAELEKIIVDLAKDGKSPAQIGLILRDKHGVPRARVFGKRVVEILEEKGIKYITEGVVTGEHVSRLKKHIAKNKHDHPASRALTKKLWVVHKLKE